ncbi:pyocin knob domain-containing protein [Pseudomonas prosekii]|uniref:Uncharacterized protein n=1 Tax=Pseudomonas prosekii TaxID=1148509 RepID=A0A1H1S0S8_9PSED|nr:pyocin knob domain-containing protein [Pseudomonas prosekii]SDS41426.1 hypothetical protein SAMN05216222_1406 [Pseudomonas prosekii]
MPWYKTGTVAVTLNSTTVIGSGTAFIANGRVGDAFRGPDGRWYEVVNIASDTALSISPAYLSSTGAGAGYALAPMQGYVKDSADALRSLVNTYGAKLAALGSTANFEVLPIIYGGTGGNTQADAQSALNLVRQTGFSDKTLNSLLVVGAFGRMGNGGLQQGNTVDANNLPVQGRYTFASGGLNLPESTCSIEHDPHAAAGYASQFAQGLTTNNLYHRTQVAGTWGAWETLVKGGANSNITSLSGLTTALSIAQGGTGNSTGTAAKLTPSAIVGTVAQSGGTPTGAIIETLTNANGTYTKLADGTLICQGPMPDFAVAAGSVATVSSPATFPALFINTNYYFECNGSPNASNDMYGFTRVNSKAVHSATAIFRNGSVAQTVANCRYVAIGRWF